MRRDERYTAPLQQSTLQNLFLHLYCQHWGEERRRGEEGSEGGAVFEQRWVFYLALLLSLSPLNPAPTTKLLTCSPRYHRFSTFTQFYLLSSRWRPTFSIASSGFSSVSHLNFPDFRVLVSFGWLCVASVRASGWGEPGSQGYSVRRACHL